MVSHCGTPVAPAFDEHNSIMHPGRTVWYRLERCRQGTRFLFVLPLPAQPISVCITLSYWREPLKTYYANRLQCRVLVYSSPITLIGLVAHPARPCTRPAR